MKQRIFHEPTLFCLVWLLLFASHIFSQPYVDPIQIRYIYGLRNDKALATPHTHLWAGCDLPIKIGKETYLLISPYAEQWQIDSADHKEIYPAVKGYGLPLGLILPLGQSKWSLTMLPMLRWNGEESFGENTFQLGGAALATIARKPTQKFRFGMYVNTEFFGFYFMPLLGTDWRIDERNYLFGVLPGRLTYEHQLSNKLYCGTTFRSITNSYRLVSGDFMRLEDNQLSLFLDYYLTKNICVTLEPGFGLLRKVSIGNADKEILSKEDWGDGLFIKISSSYRIRLPG